MLKAKRKHQSLVSVLDELQKQRAETEIQERVIKAQREREIQEEYERERERRIKELKEEKERQEMKRQEKLKEEQELRESKRKECQREMDEGLLMEKEDRQCQAWKEEKEKEIKKVNSDGEKIVLDDRVRNSGGMPEGSVNQTTDAKENNPLSPSKALDLESLARQIEEKETTPSLPKNQTQEETKNKNLSKAEEESQPKEKKKPKKKKEDDPGYEWQERPKKKGGGGCVLL